MPALWQRSKLKMLSSTIRTRRMRGLRKKAKARVAPAVVEKMVMVHKVRAMMKTTERSWTIYPTPSTLISTSITLTPTHCSLLRTLTVSSSRSFYWLLFCAIMHKLAPQANTRTQSTITNLCTKKRRPSCTLLALSPSPCALRRREY